MRQSPKVVPAMPKKEMLEIKEDDAATGAPATANQRLRLSERSPSESEVYAEHLQPQHPETPSLSSLWKFFRPSFMTIQLV